MPKLSPETVSISDGDIKLYKRQNSSLWQAKFKIAGKWIRISTDTKKLDDAKSHAKIKLLEYQIKERNQIPIVPHSLTRMRACYPISNMPFGSFLMWRRVRQWQTYWKKSRTSFGMTIK